MRRFPIYRIMKIGQKIDSSVFSFQQFQKPGLYRYKTNPSFLGTQNITKNWNCDYDENCQQNDADCFSTAGDCLSYGYEKNFDINGTLGACCISGFDRNVGQFEMCAGMMTKQSCSPGTSAESTTTWSEGETCDFCEASNSSSSSDCLEKAQEAFCSFCGAEDQDGIWQQAKSVYVTQDQCQAGYVVGRILDEQAGFVGRDPSFTGTAKITCLQRERKGDLLSAAYSSYSKGGCRGILCNNTSTQSPITKVIVNNDNCSYCDSVVYISETCDAYVVDCAPIPANLNNSHCFCGLVECGGTETECGLGGSDYWNYYADCDLCKCVKGECKFLECGCDPNVSNCVSANCSSLNVPGYKYVVDCDNCRCAKQATGGDGGDGGGGTSSSTSGGDGGTVFTSSSSSFGLVTPLPVYTQANIFYGTLPDGTQANTDAADSAEMTNGNSYDSSTRVLQTLIWNMDADSNPSSVWLKATFAERIEFTHVRIGPPPCYADPTLDPKLANSGAINGNYTDSVLKEACDGTFYLGAVVEYSEDQFTWTSLGAVSSNVFLNSNKTSVTNEIIGSPTIKTAQYFRVLSNGGPLAISEFAVAFISNIWITILNPQPNFTTSDNGATFKATTIATLNVPGQLYYQWQIKIPSSVAGPGDDRDTWNDITGLPGISGQNTNTLTITPDIPTIYWNGTREVDYDYDKNIFRCIVTATGAMRQISAQETFDMPFIEYGCTDPNANNYNSQAQVDDGKCTYS